MGFEGLRPQTHFRRTVISTPVDATNYWVAVVRPGQREGALTRSDSFETMMSTAVIKAGHFHGGGRLEAGRKTEKRPLKDICSFFGSGSQSDFY